MNVTVNDIIIVPMIKNNSTNPDRVAKVKKYSVIKARDF